MLLYKFFTPDRASFVKDRLIRFTQPTNFNDPFDCLPAITGYTEKEAKEQADRVANDMVLELALGDFSNLPPGITLDAIKYSSEVLSKEYAADPSSVGLRFAAALHNKMRTQIGILCLCENHRNILMWSHYARNHEGFVVGFESKDAFFKHREDEPLEIGELRPVQYIKRRPSLHLDMIKNPEIKTPDFLFSKSRDWAYEREWRIIRFLKHADKVCSGDVYLFKVPTTAIREIIFGFKAGDFLKRTLLDAAKIPELAHVKFTKAVVSRSEYEMDILPLDAPEPFNLALAWLKARDETKAKGEKCF
jgi:hypothetical protein